MNTSNPFRPRTSGLRRKQPPATVADGPDDTETDTAHPSAEWESKALMAGYGAFFIGAIKSFLLMDLTGQFLMITAGLTVAGFVIVGLILLSRMYRNRRASRRDLLILALMLGVCFALVRNAVAQQQRWQNIRARLDAMRERLAKDEIPDRQINRGDEEDRPKSDSDQHSDSDQ